MRKRLRARFSVRVFFDETGNHRLEHLIGQARRAMRPVILLNCMIGR